MTFARVVSAAFARPVIWCRQIIDGIFVSLAPRPQVPRKRPYIIRDAAVPGGAGDVLLAGELTMPVEGGPFPAVILITGSGAQNRNEEVAGHKVFLVLSDYLTRRGYAVLRYDDRGVGGSRGDFSTATTADFAADAAAALSWLRSQPEIDASRAGYAGHSEGGYVAALTAQIERPDFMILLAGPSQVLSEVAMLQVAEIGAASGMSESVLAVENRNSAKLMEILRSSKTPGDARDQLGSYLRDQGIPETAVREGLDLWATPWGLWIVDFDPRQLLAAYEGPVLALFGEKDLQVSAAANAPDMQSALRHSGSEVHTLSGLNHLFQPAETGLPDEYWRIETTFDEGAMKTIVDWLDRTVR